MKLSTLANKLNHPYMVKRQQRDGQVVTSYMYASNQEKAIKGAINDAPAGTVIRSVERLYHA